MAAAPDIQYDIHPLSGAVYNQLRAAVGWHTLPPQRADAGVGASLHSITASHGDEVVGCERLVGDGQVYFYVQDLLVLPAYQHLGVGSALMQRLMHYLDTVAPPKSGAYIGMMIAPGLEAFYGSFGFKLLPDDSPAMGQWRNGH